MARVLGFPARVVFGFLVPSGTAATGAVTLTGADVSAWIEVQTSQSGWVTVDPNPPVRPVPQQERQDPKQISRPQSVVPPPQDTTDLPLAVEPFAGPRDSSATPNPLRRRSCWPPGSPDGRCWHLRSWSHRSPRWSRQNGDDDVDAGSPRRPGHGSPGDGTSSPIAHSTTVTARRALPTAARWRGSSAV